MTAMWVATVVTGTYVCLRKVLILIACKKCTNLALLSRRPQIVNSGAAELFPLVPSLTKAVKGTQFA